MSAQRNLLPAACAALLALTFAARADDAKPPSAAGSLDEQLLEGLEDDLMEDIAPREKPEPNAPAPDAAKPEPDGLDRKLLDELEGETGEAADPLTKIGAKMRRAARQIANRQTQDETRDLQQEIVADIEELLKQARKKKSSSSSGQSKSEQQARRSEAAQPQSKPSRAGGASQASNNPARDSEATMRNRQAERPDPATTRQLMQELWGHLPERDRQQVLSATGEVFVPKYEARIKEYFKRLSEARRGE